MNMSHNPMDASGRMRYEDNGRGRQGISSRKEDSEKQNHEIRKAKTTMKANQYILTAGLAVAVVWATDARASLINVGDSLTIHGGLGSLRNSGQVNNGRGGTSYHNISAGLFSVQVVNLSQANNAFTIGTFCTDLGVSWNSATTRYTAVAFAGATGLSPTWSVVPQAIQNVSYIYNQYYLPAAANNSLTADEASGMQLAIWEALYDTGSLGTISGSLSSGNFRARNFDTGTMTDAAAYVADVNAARTGGWNFTQYTNTWLDPVNNNSQGLIWNNTVHCPEPTTMIAGALLLLPFGASTLRFLRKNRSM
jgi:hypothetical protein